MVLVNRRDISGVSMMTMTVCILINIHWLHVIQIKIENVFNDLRGSYFVRMREFYSIYICIIIIVYISMFLYTNIFTIYRAIYYEWREDQCVITIICQRDPSNYDVLIKLYKFNIDS